MKLAPIIRQLANSLPRYTDKFTDAFDVTSLTTSGTTATATTSTAHGFNTGDAVLIVGAIDLVNIASLTVANNIATAETSLDHGLSMAMNFKDFSRNLTVDTIGANEAQLNGEFKLLSVPNRKKFSFQVNTSDITATGTPQVYNYSGQRLNGAHLITVTGPTTFTFTIEVGADITAIGTIKTHSTRMRLSASVNLERAIESYTAQSPDKYWMFLTYEPAFTSKDRNVLNDAPAQFVKGYENRQRIIDSFGVVVFVPTSNSISARFELDELMDVRVALFKSIMNFKTPQQFDANSEFGITYSNESVAFYNTAFVAYQYIFSTTYDITYNDFVPPQDLVPFRDISFTDIKVGTQGLELGVDLDDEPIQ
jgi:hypothetical protein